jgi:hypothetical protein
MTMFIVITVSIFAVIVICIIIIIIQVIVTCRLIVLARRTVVHLILTEKEEKVVGCAGWGGRRWGQFLALKPIPCVPLSALTSVREVKVGWHAAGPVVAAVVKVVDCAARVVAALEVSATGLEAVGEQNLVWGHATRLNEAMI